MKTSIVILAAFLAVGCRSSADSASGSEEIEGWRVEDNQDVFYMRIPGSASQRAADADDMAMMKSTCIDASRVQAADNIIRKMLGETVQGQSGVMDGQSTGTLITSVRNGLIRGTQVKECAPRDERKRWQNCECVHFVSGKGLKKKFELAVEQSVKK
jgi:hypothetical protein